MKNCASITIKTIPGRICGQGRMEALHQLPPPHQRRVLHRLLCETRGWGSVGGASEKKVM